MHNESDHSPWLRRQLRLLRMAVLAIGIGFAGNVGFTYKSIDDAQRLSSQLQAQEHKVNELSKQVAVLQAFSAYRSAHHEPPPGICVCVKKGGGSQVTKLCPAKGETCDDESRKVCNSINPQYEC